jgi:hypothetical protein
LDAIVAPARRCWRTTAAGPLRLHDQRHRRTYYRVDTRRAGQLAPASSQTITARAKVQAIDLATREVTLVGPEGNVFSVHAGDAVRNLDKVKVGDTVVATYYASIVLVLSAPGTQVPDNQVNTALARAAKGQMPAGAPCPAVTLPAL